MNKSNTAEELEAQLGEQIRFARLRQNFSQEMLANMAGVALGSVRNLEKGQGATIATFVRILRALRLEEWIDRLQPAVTISPMQMLKAKQPRQRARAVKAEV